MARPIAYARADGPPVLLMHGLADQTVKLWNARELREALVALGNAAELIITHSPRRQGWPSPIPNRVLDFEMVMRDSTAPPRDRARVPR